MKIYIINLEKDYERYMNTKKQLLLNNISDSDITRINAIYGKKLDQNILNSSNLTPAQIGCLSSHVKTLKQIIKDNVEYALVLEDDIVLSESFPKLEEIISTLPKTFDICWVGNCRAKWPRNTCSIIPDPAYDYKKLEKINDYIWRIDGKSHDNYPMGAYGLVISKKGAKRALDIVLSNKFMNPIDMIYVKSDMENYMTVPSIITHCYDFGSNIAPDPYLIIKKNPFENVWKKNPDDERSCLEILQILYDFGLNYSLIYGTLLGYARNKKFISYDNDVTIMIERNEIKNFEKMIPSLEKYMNIYKFKKPKQELYYKLYPKKIEGYEYGYPFIDIFIYDKNQKGILYGQTGIRIGETFYDISEDIIDTEISSNTENKVYKTKLIKDYKNFLDIQYKNWENICVSKSITFYCKNISI
jgi:GR25 family glycosyltransferase involved in LPS biosynthesis